MRWSKIKFKKELKKVSRKYRSFKPYELDLWFRLMYRPHDYFDISCSEQFWFLRANVINTEFETLSLPNNKSWYREEFIRLFDPLRAVEMIDFYGISE